jgi:hypothetical protein
MSEKPDAVLVKIERVPRLVDDPDRPGHKIDKRATRIPYEDGGHYEHYDFDHDTDRFEVPVIVADAAVASGFFRAGE